jgi:predicted Rossmann fold nucleotide-binding protein DprA/Smf involved in DNA uptake
LKVLRPPSLREGRREPVGPGPEIPADWAPVWGALAAEATHIDSVIERSGLQSAQVLGILLQMELRGLVQQQSGKRFLRAAN